MSAISELSHLKVTKAKTAEERAQRRKEASRDNKAGYLFLTPWLIGLVADHFGQPDMMLTPLGKALESLGAVPMVPEGRAKPENLVAGLLIVVPAVALSGLVLLAGSRHLPREMALMVAKLKARPAGVALPGKDEG